MKRIAISISLALVVLSVASLIFGRAQEGTAPPKSGGPPLANPLKVALLKWYPANQITSFEVGDKPLGIAFDGRSIWVANFGSSSVTKLQASDGSELGTFEV